MNLIFALLAFAGLMAFLSTVASVFVEAIHKLFALRRAGLEELLRSIHARVLTQLDPNAQQKGVDALDATATAESKEFARIVTHNVALIGGGRFSAMRSMPLLSGLFRKRFERLSTLQFIEQMAQTPIGQTLAELPRTARARALGVAAYQYERFGEQQSAYFQSRARIVSVLVAMVFAFALNIDALNIFDRLYRDIGVRDSVLSMVDGGVSAQAATGAAQNAVPGASEAALAQRAVDAGAQGAVAELKSLGIPIGFGAFPYCVGPTSVNDARCGGAQTPALSLAFAGERLATGNWGLWFLSVLVAGGFIGLGAPFWYDLFRKITRLVPAARAAQSLLGATTGPDRASATTLSVRPTEAATPEALLTAFDMASGKAAEAIAGTQHALAAATPASRLPGAADPVSAVPLTRHAR
jgi:hypothetical protein